MNVRDADVAIIAPTGVEWLGVLRHLTATTDVENFPLPAKIGTIGTHVVLCCASGKGQEETASAATLVLERARPRNILLVGIAGGFPSHGVRRGDVVVAHVIHSFDYGKLFDGSFIRRPENDINCDRNLLAWAEIVAADASSQWRRTFVRVRPDGRDPSDFRVHVDCYVASSNKVVDDPDHVFYSAVAAAFPEIHCVEMEGSGAGASARLAQSERAVRFLMVRGISDEPGSGPIGKDQRNEWKEYAVASAAAFTRALIEQIPSNTARRNRRPRLRTPKNSFGNGDLGNTRSDVLPSPEGLPPGSFDKAGITDADCLILTSLAEETMPVLFQFRHFRKIVLPGQRFPCYETHAPNGLRVISASSTTMGKLAMESLIHTVISTFNPKTILLVGIAGGMDKDIALGDVVVSEEILNYELGKAGDGGFAPRWSVCQPDAKLLARAKAWPNQTWQQYIRAPRPVQSGTPALHSGIFLSGDTIIADEKVAGALRSVWRKAAAIEMEGAGVASTLYHIKVPPAFLVFRGISDYVDSKKNVDSEKNNQWREYAADAAASCAFSFVLDHMGPSDIQAVRSNRATRTPQSQSDNRAIRVALSTAYNLAELKQLSFDLDIDWEDISGNSKSEKIVDFLLYCKRHDKIEKLVDLVNSERDNLLNAYYRRRS
jgi:adenosylhomocysteine nucleosidase